MTPRADVFGWFDDPGTTPAHDPGPGGLCPVCGAQFVRFDEPPVVTISLMPVGGARSYFFRAHPECWRGLDESEQSGIESSLIDEIREVVS